MRNRRTMTLSVATILIASIFAGASTFAYYTDTETSTDNTFVAGIFDIELVPGKSLPFIASNIKPGWSRDEEHSIINTGDTAGEVCIKAENFIEPTMAGYVEPPEPESSTDATEDEFAQMLLMEVYADIDGNNVFEEDELIYEGSLFDMETDRFAIGPGETIKCMFYAYFPTDLADPNLYQADGVECDIVFYADTEITI